MRNIWAFHSTRSASPSPGFSIVHTPTPAASATSWMRRASACARSRSAMLRGLVQRHAGQCDHPALRVTLGHAPRQQVPVAAVAVQIARLDVDHAGAGDGLLGGTHHGGQVIGMHQRSHLVQAQALGTRRQAVEAVAAVVDVDAPACRSMRHTEIMASSSASASFALIASCARTRAALSVSSISTPSIVAGWPSAPLRTSVSECMSR